MEKIIIVAPIYNYYPILIHSLQAQTYKNWELHLIHDGLNSDLKDIVTKMKDDRIIYQDTLHRYNDWGHSLRRRVLENLSESDGDFLLITNADNYYIPIFLEEMIKPLKDSSFIASYCNILHSHRKWKKLETYLERAQIDCGCVLIKLKEALSVIWDSTLFWADWIYIDKLLQKFGKEVFYKVNKILFIHN